MDRFSLHPGFVLYFDCHPSPENTLQIRKLVFLSSHVFTERPFKKIPEETVFSGDGG